MDLRKAGDLMNALPSALTPACVVAHRLWEETGYGGWIAKARCNELWRSVTGDLSGMDR